MDLWHSRPGLSELLIALFLFSGFIKSREWLGFVSNFGDLTLISGGLLSIICAFQLLLKPKIPLWAGQHLVGFLVFIGVLITSYMLGNQPTEATIKLSRVLIYGGGALLAGAVLLSSPRKIDGFYFIMLVLGVAGGVHEILVNPLVRFGQEELSESGAYQWSSRMSFYAILVAVFYMHWARRNTIKLILALAAITASFGVLLGGGRQGILALVACLLYLWFISGRSLTRTFARIKALHLFLFSLLFLLLYLAYVYYLKPLLGITSFTDVFSSKLITFLNILTVSDGVVSNILRARESIFHESWVMFANNPIFGVGFGEFLYHSELSYFRHSHNLILELLSETGVVGLFAFMFFWGPVLFQLFNRKLISRSSPRTRLAAFLIVGQLAMMQVSGDLGNNSLIFFFGVLFVASIHFDKSFRSGPVSLDG